jgi:hypothetical protein
MDYIYLYKLPSLLYILVNYHSWFETCDFIFSKYWNLAVDDLAGGGGGPAMLLVFVVDGKVLLLVIIISTNNYYYYY